jgi:hypothetical protein
MYEFYEYIYTSEDLILLVGMKWNGMEWNRMEWNGME